MFTCFKKSAVKDDKRDEQTVNAGSAPTYDASDDGPRMEAKQTEILSNQVGTAGMLGGKSKSFTNRPLKGSDQGAGAQEQNLEWMNYILSSMWPKFRAAGNKLGHKIISAALADAIKEKKETGVLDIDVECKIDLDIGENPPVFSALRSYHTGHDETEGVEVDLAMSFKPKDSWHFVCHVVGSVGPVPINCDAGVSYFEISGVCSMILTPLLDVVPVFGGGQVFFLDTPTVKMQFTGMGGLHTFAPLVMKTLRAAVVKNLQSQLVLPNSKFIPIRNIPLDTRIDLTSPLPEGVLQCTVHAAKGLKAADFSLTGRHSSDPTINVQVGSAKFKTRSINKSLNPVWDPPHVGYLFVHNPNQALTVEVFDDDLIGEHDFLAYLDGWTIIDATENKSEWFNLTPAPPGPGEKPLTKEEMNPQLRLEVEYLEVCDLPSQHHRASQRTVKQNCKPCHKCGGPRALDVDHVEFLRVLSVRLLGLDCDERHAQQLWHSHVLVSIFAGPAPWSDGEKPIIEETIRFDDVKPAVKATAGTSEPTTFLEKFSRGIVSLAKGITNQDDRATETRKSGKAKLWGAEGGAVGAKGAGMRDVPAQVQLMIERLHMQKNMPIPDIAEIANMDEETVRLLIELRRQFKVVWHQALHFQLEHPSYGVEMELKTIDGLSLGKVYIDLLKDLAGETALRRKVKMGCDTIPDVIFEFEVELRGLKHGSIQVPNGFRRGANSIFKQHHTEHTAVQIEE